MEKSKYVLHDLLLKSLSRTTSLRSVYGIVLGMSMYGIFLYTSKLGVEIPMLSRLEEILFHPLIFLLIGYSFGRIIDAFSVRKIDEYYEEVFRNLDKISESRDLNDEQIKESYKKILEEIVERELEGSEKSEIKIEEILSSTNKTLDSSKEVKGG